MGGAGLRREAPGICEELHDTTCVAQALRGDGNAYLLARRIKQAEDSYNQALRVARRSGDLVEQVNNLNGLGVLHSELADFEGAVPYYREALGIGREL